MLDPMGRFKVCKKEREGGGGSEQILGTLYRIFLALFLFDLNGKIRNLYFY